jgi:hypothetical protein
LGGGGGGGAHLLTSVIHLRVSPSFNSFRAKLREER